MYNPISGDWILKSINEGNVSSSNLSTGKVEPGIQFYDYVDPAFWIQTSLFPTTQSSQITEPVVEVKLESRLEFILGVVIGSFILLVVLVILIILGMRRRIKKKPIDEIDLNDSFLISMNDVEKKKEIKKLTESIEIWVGSWRHQEWYLLFKYF